MAQQTQDWSRPYVVLERLSLKELLEREPDLDTEVYFEVALVRARNTEHANTLGGHEAWGDNRTAMMVAVSTRNFQPKPVDITSSRSVRVG